MEKQICPRCFGNGFIKVQKDYKEEKEIVVQCTMCDSEGEVSKLEGPLNELREKGGL